MSPGSFGKEGRKVMIKPAATKIAPKIIIVLPISILVKVSFWLDQNQQKRDSGVTVFPRMTD